MERITNLHPVGYEKLVVSSTSVGLASIPARARVAFIRCEGDDVRFRDDGTDPTSAEGVRLKEDELLFYDGALPEIEFIRVTTDGTLYILYYGF